MNDEQANALEIEVTAGEWIVTPSRTDLPNYLTIRCAHDDQPIAIVPPKDGKPNWSDAAVMSASKHALDALIKIHDLICFSKESFSIEKVDEIVSLYAEKVNAEVIA